jgi:hypothetical protein
MFFPSRSGYRPGLARLFWLGLSHLEARILPAQDFAQENAAVLRNPAQLG